MTQNYNSISLVLTVYNGAESLAESLKSIISLVYPSSKYELILVDDKSTDDTLKIANKYKKIFKESNIDYKVIKLHKNQGRIKARIKGVEAAKYDRIMIIDVQMRLQNDVLDKINNYSSDQNIITNLIMEKYGNCDSTVMYLLRKWYYKPYWGNSFANIQITSENFKKISKGTGGFVTSKSSFIRYSKKLAGSKIENEDTKLFSYYLKGGESLIRVFDVKSEYVNRSGISSIKHVFNRGPRFVDYYLKNSLKPLIFLIASFVLVMMLPVLMIYNTNFLLIIPIFYTIIFFFALLIAENLKDFIIIMLYLPIIAAIFYAGLLHGVYLHWKINEIKK